MPTCLAICGTTAAVDPPGPFPPAKQPRYTVLCEDIVRPVCAQLGITFLRADWLTEAGLPMDQLHRMLTEADVVVADLGGSGTELSSVLAARQALGRCTVRVTDGTEQPLGSGTTLRIPFPSPPADTATALRQLTGALTQALGRDGVLSLPKEASPGICPAPVAGGDDDSPGLFDLVVEAEAQLEAISGDMADVESALTDLGEMMELIGEEMARVSHPGASMNKRMAVINRLAKAIEGPAEDLLAAAERFAARMETNVEAFRAFLEWAASTPRREWPEGAEEVLEQVGTAAEEAQGAAGNFREVMAVISMFGSSSRQLRRPSRQINTSIQTIFRSVAVLDELRGRAMELRES
ncbi:hypothetical protein GTW44_14995 [Streptomyces sp. SID8360]|nr:hypothetical protein SACTE_3128 [Streptomyces sp. SirexAA-E]MYR65972.1 hypothetical protein [Streptomyces sp. SID4939]MYR99019.1 hypothetical protein [Streptomyces sp. SID4940]MYT63736.1 hypothetical protein [Streptomyces sp. SID8357]MYT85986.1 hypothetical protein [Streptomyces sp. SID8360]MYW38463.1 hypothetical protein [Streptomyces sp. SID1]PZX41708.1 hypothetical protein K373_01934 [Streptomyces sp. DvalAA-21]RAJ38105.1 hypothetical protein K351_01681 [Streptomyces sp. DpondAA-E10]R